MPTRRVFVLCLMPFVLLAAVTVADEGIGEIYADGDPVDR